MKRHANHVLFLFAVALFAAAQDSPVNHRYERTFPQPVADVTRALQRLPGGTSGQLPVLDGFVVAGAHPLSSYRRPFYQCEVHVKPAKSGGSLVTTTAKITAWFSSPEHSGYEVLLSNGRLESDLLDRLQDALTAGNRAPSESNDRSSPVARTAAPNVDAPMPQLPSHPVLSSGPNSDAGPQDSQLQQEAKSLEEILRNQSHPTNLIAVKRDATPVLQSPVADAKVLFLASAEDEFEVLEENPGWVHVRISGLSRGWLRRSMVEAISESSPSPPDPVATPAQAQPASAEQQVPEPFSVSSEEMGSFPGEWQPLKGKNVRIISLQQASGTGRITSPQEKKQFAEALFRKELSSLPPQVAGVALVFDAEDGGIVATTRAALEQWSSGTLSSAAFWKQCFLDPAEIMGAN